MVGTNKDAGKYATRVGGGGGAFVASSLVSEDIRQATGKLKSKLMTRCSLDVLHRLGEVITLPGMYACAGWLTRTRQNSKQPVLFWERCELFVHPRNRLRDLYDAPIRSSCDRPGPNLWRLAQHCLQSTKTHKSWCSTYLKSKTTSLSTLKLTVYDNLTRFFQTGMPHEGWKLCYSMECSRGLR